MRSRLLNIVFIGITVFSETLYLEAFKESHPLVSIFLILSITGIAFAGYLDNDRSDKAIDHINHKSRLVISSTWSYVIYTISFLSGLTSLIIFDSDFTNPSAPIFCLALGIPIILLRAYARWLSSYKAIGNVLIAFLCCLSLTMPGLLHGVVPQVYWQDLEPFLILLFAAVYIREIIKDAEDQRGDKILGRRTLPLYLGDNFKFYVLTLEFVLLALVTCGFFVFDWSIWITLILISYIASIRVVHSKRQNWRRMQLFWKGFIGLGVVFRILTLHTQVL